MAYLTQDLIAIAARHVLETQKSSSLAGRVAGEILNKGGLALSASVVAGKIYAAPPEQKYSVMMEETANLFGGAAVVAGVATGATSGLRMAPSLPGIFGLGAKSALPSPMSLRRPCNW